MQLKLTTSLSDFQLKAANLKLQAMFAGNYFSICTIDEIGNLIGVNPKMGGKDYQALHLLHCVSWDQMDREMIQNVQLKSFEVLGITLHLEPPREITVEIAEEVKSSDSYSPAKPKTFFQRLLLK
jgi:hypothetical protein